MNLFQNDLESTDITLKTNTPCNTEETSGTDIITAFSNFDDEKEEQVSTTDTNTLKSPIEYCILS